MTHAVANGLRAKGFLGYLEGAVYPNAMPFTIHPFVWRELVKHKFDLLSKDDWEDSEVIQTFENIDGIMAENERETYR